MYSNLYLFHPIKGRNADNNFFKIHRGFYEGYCLVKRKRPPTHCINTN